MQPLTCPLPAPHPCRWQEQEVEAMLEDASLSRQTSRHGNKHSLTSLSNQGLPNSSAHGIKPGHVEVSVSVYKNCT